MHFEKDCADSPTLDERYWESSQNLWHILCVNLIGLRVVRRAGKHYFCEGVSAKISIWISRQWRRWSSPLHVGIIPSTGGLSRAKQQRKDEFLSLPELAHPPSLALRRQCSSSLAFTLGLVWTPLAFLVLYLANSRSSDLLAFIIPGHNSYSKD